jgi:hypothetical protein
MHLYVGVRLARLWGYDHAWTAIAACTLAALVFPAASLFEKFMPTAPTMMLYTLASVWLGVVFLLMCACLCYEVLRFVLPVTPAAAARCIVGAVALVSAYGLVNALLIRVSEIEIPLLGISRAYRIVQLSDIHVGTIHNSGFLTRIVDKTNALAPDLILITGDMFDGLGPVDGHTVAPLKMLAAKTYFVIGNHERYDDMRKIETVLTDTGVEFLRNRVAEYKGLQVIGIDAPLRDGQNNLHLIHEIGFDRTRPSILMYHIPSGMGEAERAGVGLVLSGHTHNGQLFPFTLLVRLMYPYVRGLYRIGNLQLYVSPGTGTWGPPMRIGSSNEITLIRLVPAV